MPLETTYVNTFTCSIGDCKARRIIGGPQSIAVDHIQGEGWVLGETIFGVDYDFCKEHADELQEWLGEDGPPTSKNE